MRGCRIEGLRILVSGSFAQVQPGPHGQHSFRVRCKNYGIEIAIIGAFRIGW